MSKAEQNKREREVTRATLRLFWRANLQQKWSLVLGYAMRLSSFTANIVLIPLAVAYGLQAIINHQFDAVQHYSLMVLLLMLFHGVAVAIGEWAVINNALVACEYAQKTIFNNYLNKDYEFYSDAFFGSLGAQAAQIRDATQTYGRLVTLDIPKQAVTIVAGLIIIGIKAPLLALVTLVCMGLVLSFTIISSQWRVKWRRRVSIASSEMAGVIGDALTHSTTVKSFATEEYENNRLNASLEKWKRAQYKAWITATPAVIGRSFFSAITIAILLIMTGRMYQDGAISIAIVALVQLYVIRMIVAASDISEIVKEYEIVMGSAYQSVKTMLIEPLVKDKAVAHTLPKLDSIEVAFDQVTYRYGEAVKSAKAVNDFSLTIEKGQKIGLVGYSGSGKTTLTKLLLRFIDVTEGAIKIDGVDIRDLHQGDLRRVISYVPQEPLLFHRSIGENIAYADPRATSKQILMASRAANVEEFVRELPAKYDTLVGEHGVKLSGGQRQRVAIARAILKNAPILVLDEATSALDSESEKLIQEALWKLMEDRTALVIAHRLSTIQRMDKIVVMDKGKIVQAGTHKELLAQKNGIYAKLWAHQSGGYIVEDPESNEAR